MSSLKAGKRADLLLLPDNPLLDLTVLRRFSGVMTRGRWVSAEQLRGMLQEVLLRNQTPRP